MPNEMRNDLGVSFGMKLVTDRLQTFLKRQIVFDNSVVNDDYLARLIAVRMGILLGRTSVRRPTRMANAIVAIERIQPNSFLEIPQLALSPPQAQIMLVINDSDPRRIVSAILQLPQTVNDQRHNLFISNVSDNSTHKN